ncbi:hypothetical protein NQ314_018170 [Rhamnusium bicolor]|uniref:MADF domain-containing protein n=1 Tax=Rhamnusium bicolor TaxID=1586634 RepID=A0AAV8WSE1_9CUCU|nr:hypothetical protein NQ314_018170 [Rhamnusium bicolor]
MEWSNEKVMSLIDLYRDRPVLWNCRLKEYKDRNKRHDAFVEIAVSFGGGKEEVERKLKNLICQFSREVKKERDSVKSGTGEEVYKSKWFAYQSMEFLKDRNRARGMTDTQVRFSNLFL